MKRDALRCLGPLFLVLLPLVALTSGCGSREDPVLSLSSEEALNLGKEQFEREKWYRARRYLTHAFEIAPNSPGGREALLLAADTFFMQGGEANLIQAEAKYRDFLARFPTSNRSDYVQYQIANSLARRMERPDRDQTVTERALQTYEELLQLYPTSEYAALAREQIRVVRDQLAEHEYTVGDFYLTYGLPPAAAKRFEGILEEYPDYSRKERLYLDLGIAYIRSARTDEADEIFHRLKREYPDSEYIDDIPHDDLEEMRKRVAEANAAREAREAAEAAADASTEEEAEP